MTIKLYGKKGGTILWGVEKYLCYMHCCDVAVEIIETAIVEDVLF